MYSQPRSAILEKISNHHQIGGIETSILDNGKGKGIRIAWINTGAGLRYKVVLDRAMDIADAHFNQYNLAWISDVGITQPHKTGFYDNQWLAKFGGGLMTTCGLTHVGANEQDEHGYRELHGNISYEPAEIISIIQPDLNDEFPVMSITGLIKETTSFGQHLELKRTISSILGQPSIYINDEITNRSNTELPHMLMYHCNFGWPLVDEGSIISWRGDWQPRGSNSDYKIFNKENNFSICKPPMDKDEHFNEEACAFIDIESDDKRLCKSGITNKNLNLTIEVLFNKNELPWLTNWLHYKKGEYVVGLEPGTNPPIGQSKARKDNALIFLKPNETRKYSLEIKVKNHA